MRVTVCSVCVCACSVCGSMCVFGPFLSPFYYCGFHVGSKNLCAWKTRILAEPEITVAAVLTKFLLQVFRHFEIWSDITAMYWVWKS